MRLHDPEAPKPKEIEDHPDRPPWFPWVWEWFLDLRAGVSWSEIDSWSRMTGIKPNRWESQLLIELDRVRT